MMEAVRRLRGIGDVLLGLGLTLLVQAEVWLSPAPDPDEIPLTVTLGGSLRRPVAALAFPLSLIWRRRAPLLSLLLAYPALGLAGTASLDAAISLTVAVMVA